MNIEKRKAIALNTFKGTYPSISSADLQTFILGMQAMKKIYQDVELEMEALIDAKNEAELNALENQSVEC